MDDRYKDKRVLVFGLGVNQGGVGSARFFAKEGAQVRVTDLKTEYQLKSSLDELSAFKNIEYILGQHRNEDIDWADLIIKNPGVKPGNSYIEYGEKLGKRIELDIGIFLEFVPATRLVGVTGTKGKSTTASLIYEALNAGGLDALLAGNIGKSVLDAIPQIRDETLAVLELSSFQLEAFEKHQLSPKWAIITNITPDHLNYYSSMSEYIQSKRSIAKYQTAKDYLFIRRNDRLTTKPDFLKGFRAQIVYFSAEDLPVNFKPKIMGKHNLDNIAAALSVAQTFGLDKEKTLKVLGKFGGVEFRLQLIKKWQGVRIYNDTTATGPDAGIKALEVFPGCILIAGGVNKNLPYEQYAKTVEKLAKKVFFLEGDATEEMKRQIKRKGLVAGTYRSLEKLLGDLKQIAKNGDTILFSPAAASFNLFQNEFDRGRQFNAAVQKIFD